MYGRSQIWRLLVLLCSLGRRTRNRQIWLRPYRDRVDWSLRTRQCRQWWHNQSTTQNQMQQHNLQVHMFQYSSSTFIMHLKMYNNTNLPCLPILVYKQWVNAFPSFAIPGPWSTIFSPWPCQHGHAWDMQHKRGVILDTHSLAGRSPALHAVPCGRHMAKGSISKLWLFVRISALGKLRALFPLVASACLNNASFPRYLWPFCHFFVSFYGKTVYLEIEKKDR